MCFFYLARKEWFKARYWSYCTISFCGQKRLFFIWIEYFSRAFTLCFVVYLYLKSIQVHAVISFFHYLQQKVSERQKHHAILCRGVGWLPNIWEKSGYITSSNRHYNSSKVCKGQYISFAVFKIHRLKRLYSVVFIPIIRIITFTSRKTLLDE